jgi:flagellar motor switch protein FliM
MSDSAFTAEIEPKNEDSASVKKYDFKKAMRLSSEHIRGLTKIHENFSSRLSTALSNQLRTVIQLEVLTVEQMPYEEYMFRQPPSTVLCEMATPNLDIMMVITLTPKITYMLIDRLLGGKGTAEEPVKTALTTIETGVLKSLLESFSQNLQKAWADIVTFRLIVRDIKTNPKFLELTRPSDTVIIVSFNIFKGLESERMEICIPYKSVEPLSSKLLPQNWIGQDSAAKSNENSEMIQGQIENLSVPVCVELGRALISIEDFLGLAVNDVIQLNQLTEEPLKVKVNEQVKFLARPGTKRSKLAIKIEHVTEGEDNDE